MVTLDPPKQKKQMSIGLGIAGIGANVLSQFMGQAQARDNFRRQRKHNIEMYQMQNEDMLKFWDMQNKYNTPASQMARYKEAGLNPNLMYGQGTPGNAEQITPDQPQAANYDVPALNPMQTLGAYQDTEIKKAQTDNIKAQTDAQRASTIHQLFKNVKEGHLSQYYKDFILEELRQTQQKTQQNDLSLALGEKDLNIKDFVMAEKQANIDLTTHKAYWQQKGLSSDIAKGVFVILNLLGKSINATEFQKVLDGMGSTANPVQVKKRDYYYSGENSWKKF